jgi:HYR domain
MRMPKSKWILLWAECAFALVFAQASSAATVTLAWEPSPERDVAGYVVLYGTEPGVYSHFLDVGRYTSESIRGLADGMTYYYAVRAYNKALLYSSPSAEISGETLSMTRQLPSLVCPTPIVTSPDGTPVRVEYRNPTVAAGVASVAIECVPSSGSIFAAGATPVKCIATDSRQQTGSCSTVVLVVPPAEKRGK